MLSTQYIRTGFSYEANIVIIYVVQGTAQRESQYKQSKRSLACFESQAYIR